MATSSTVQRPIIHVLNYGDSGGGKSSVAATFPKPMRVFLFDPIDKAMPYFARGIVARKYFNKHGTECYDIVYKKSRKLMIQVECYHENNPERPTAFDRFMKAMATFHKEYDRWATAVIDSVTFAEMAARWKDQFVTNKDARDGRQHYAESGGQLERLLAGRFSGLPMNTVANCHVNYDKDEVNGRSLRSVAAPGQTPRKLMAAFGELWHSYAKKDEDGERGFWVQTKPDGTWNCATQIDAPDPVGPFPTYEAFWENYDGSRAAIFAEMVDETVEPAAGTNGEGAATATESAS